MYMLLLTAICSGVHESKFIDFTLDICTPKFLCMPAHLIHKNTPMFHDAHLGPTKDGAMNYEASLELQKIWCHLIFIPNF